MPADTIRVIVPDTGSAYGGKRDGLITLLRRRRTPKRTSIEFPAFGPELKSAPVTRNSHAR